MKIEHSLFNTILGNMQLTVADGAIIRCHFTELLSEPNVQESHQNYVEQILDYFNGDLKTFKLPLAPVGTAFQKQVWQELMNIPYGKTITYGALSNRLGENANPRNVGQANGQNPIAIIIPCHRVVGADMKLTGYAGGLERKRKLLEIEGAFQQQTLF
jgi:methylated-DNA-[protein]-cysteine S-methyltransferase